jgi:vancomycin resistance protein VanW
MKCLAYGAKCQNCGMKLIEAMSTRVRTGLRACVPLSWRQALAQRRRDHRDRALGLVFVGLERTAEGRVTGDAKAETRAIQAPKRASRIALQQKIVPGQMYENKLQNLRRGASLVDGIVLQPGQAFSFWHCIGRASRANGFVEGRNIIQGRLQREFGGGLCQLSSLLYHLALLGGLHISERHPHSLDLYREEDRFAPLGADATVVWGVKDLRWSNPFPFAIQLGCWESEGGLYANLSSEVSWQVRRVEFSRESLPPRKDGSRVRVTTRVDDVSQLQTDYLQKPGMLLS